MLRAMERFHRIAAWSPGPAMRFHLRNSPVHLLRERLWLLTRLEPQLRISVNQANTVRTIVSPVTYQPGRMATRIINRNSSQPGLLRETERNNRMTETRVVQTSSVANSLVIETRSTIANLMSFPPFVRTVLPGTTAVESRARIFARFERSDVIHHAPPRHVHRQAASALPSPAQVGFVPGKSSAPKGFEASWPTAPVPAPVNVEQITDQVLRQLDRRLIATRERLGRI